MPAQSKIDVMEGFQLHPEFGDLGEKLGISQAPLFMLFGAILVCAFFWIAMRKKAIVPGRLQVSAEFAYTFVRDIVEENMGEKGKFFFPFIFTLFFFILAGNYIGLLPYSYTYTSHIAVTLALAIVVFVMALLASLFFQGIGFFKHFMPSGVSLWLSPILVPIEVLSWLSRPISLSVRLFANMVAGHVLMEVFAVGTIMLAGFGVVGYVFGIVPIILNMALIGLELLVGGLQAYIFALLACIYLGEAVGGEAH
ncbi:F0F1 ATP synthase subunit A [Acetobacteraceae bacterium]|nr:F0F1 ATP synthase subunit A [Acetobacteraceae bacterium]